MGIDAKSAVAEDARAATVAANTLEEAGMLASY